MFNHFYYINGVNTLLNNKMSIFREFVPLSTNEKVVQELEGESIEEDDNGSLYTIKNLYTNNLFSCKLVKFPRSFNFSKNEDVINMIKEKINLIKSLSKEGTVDISFTKITNDFIIVGIEHCPNGSLLQYKNKSLSENTIKNFAKQILYILNNLHNKRISHGNISLDNILLDVNNKIKIADFCFINKGCYQGTKIKIAPETKADNQCSDAWSLGQILLELSIGKRADGHEDVFHLLKKRKKFSKEMISFIDKCLHKSPICVLLQDTWIINEACQ